MSPIPNYESRYDSYAIKTSKIIRIQCKVGFRGDGHHCWDINECIEKSHNCVHNAYCYDTDGSFECECETNWILRTNDTECRPDVCPDGYYGHGMYCKQMPDNAECKEFFFHNTLLIRSNPVDFIRFILWSE